MAYNDTADEIPRNFRSFAAKQVIEFTSLGPFAISSYGLMTFWPNSVVCIQPPSKFRI